MAKGKVRRKLLAHSASLVEGNAAGESWNFIYQKSLVKHPDFNIGDHVVLPDGREFVYSKSSAACISGQGAEFTVAGYTGAATFTVTAAIGENELTVAAATHAALTTDELRGGYIIIFDGSTNNTMFRQILGNASAAANAAFKVQLDGEVSEAVTTSSWCETYQNPYASLRTGTGTVYPKAGVPAVKVTAADTYFFVQIKGMVWVAPQSNLGATKMHGGYWHDVGNVSDPGTSLAVTIPAAKTGQYAGYVVEGSAAGNGPLFNLQG